MEHPADLVVEQAAVTVPGMQPETLLHTEVRVLVAKAITVETQRARFAKKVGSLVLIAMPFKEHKAQVLLAVVPVVLQAAKRQELVCRTWTVTAQAQLERPELLVLVHRTRAMEVETAKPEALVLSSYDTRTHFFLYQQQLEVRP